MTKVVLFNPPYHEMIVRDNYCCHTSKGDYVWAPADLLYVSGSLNEPDIELLVIDAIAERASMEAVEKKVLDFGPDVVISLSGTLSFTSDMALLKRIWEASDCRHYLMGNLPVFNAELVLQRFDYITGIFHNFFDSRILDTVRDPSMLSNSISARLPDGSLHIGAVNYLDRKSRPVARIPQFRLFPGTKYTTPISFRSPMTTVITAFGCPYDCKFCVASALNLYTRPMENLEAEFDAIKAEGIKEVFFMDSTFNAIPNRAREICELMVRKDYGFSWSCNIHCRTVSKEDFLLMKQAGCHTIQVGVEAGSDVSRLEYAPSKPREYLKEAFQLAHEAGLRTLGYFIIGFPEEGVEEASETIRFAIELDPFFAAFTTLAPDYGTEFYLEAVEKGMVSRGLQTFDNSGKPVLDNMTLSKSEREDLLKQAYKKFYLRPAQIMKYVADLRNFPLYFRNGIHVMQKYLLG